jgi:mannitol-1-phosphate 5-dehydrogenase
MVPVMTDEMCGDNPLRVWVEPYEELPVDKAAFVGNIPDLKGLIPYSPFGYYIKRKLFIHNMGHAISAYMGWQKSYAFIYECISDKNIRSFSRAAMKESAYALHKEYGVPLQELNEHIDDLLNRFANRSLGDTVARVGRDPLRKLSYNDRLIGAALYCLTQGIEPNIILRGIIAALKYENITDESSVEMQSMIKNSGITEFLKTHCGLDKEAALVTKIVGELNKEA